MNELKLHQQNQIEKLITQCGLGTIQNSIQQLTGGFMHKMFAVETTTGKYAVKFLNPQIMKRPTAFANFERAEKFEQILVDNHLPVVAALFFNGKKMQQVDDFFFMFFHGKKEELLIGKKLLRNNVKLQENCRQKFTILIHKKNHLSRME